MTGAGLVDISVFVAEETGRPLAAAGIERAAVSVITVAELRVGVLAADSDAVRARRLETLSKAQRPGPLPVDEAVAAAWARLRQDLRRTGRRLAANDSWIAATAIAHSLPVLTQDADYDDVPGLEVVRV